MFSILAADRPTERANSHNHNNKEGTLTAYSPLPLSNSSTYSNSIHPFLHSLFVQTPLPLLLHLIQRQFCPVNRKQNNGSTMLRHALHRSSQARHRVVFSSSWISSGTNYVHNHSKDMVHRHHTMGGSMNICPTRCRHDHLKE